MTPALCCRGSHARPLQARPHKPFASLLDAHPPSKLQRCVPPGDDPASGRCSHPRKEKYPAHSETPPVTGVLSPAIRSRALHQSGFFHILGAMEVHFAPDLQAKIDQLVIETGCAPDKLLEDAMAGYVPELAETRDMLNSRYDDLKSGRVKPIDGDAFFESLRQREEELLKQHSPR